jgi:thioredoxin-related protein
VIEATQMKTIRYLIMKSAFLLIVVTVFMHFGCASQGNGKVNWMTFEEAIEANQLAPKRIFIDVYTKWCSWCKVMDNKTFSDSTVAAYMNENFYCVKLDAEMKDTIVYKDTKFYFVPEYKSHALAVSLLDGKMSYPSYVFLTEKEQRLKIISGYQEKDVFLQNLKILKRKTKFFL